MVLTQAACYQVLGLPAAAPVGEVRRAYRSLARRLHPDVHSGDDDRFKRITAAYNILTGRQKAEKAHSPRRAPRRPTPRPARPARPEPTRRSEAPVDHASAWAEWRGQAEAARAARADRVEAEPHASAEAPFESTEAPAEPQPAPTEAACPSSAACPVDEARPARKRPLLRRLRDKLRRPRRVTQAAIDLRGEDVILRLPLDLDFVMTGGDRTIAVTRAAACPTCERGGDVECVCGGKGRIKVREKVRVAIPAGARHGVRLRIAGKGTAGLGGEIDGDLYLVLEPQELAGFRREGADLVGNIDVDRRVARHGGTVEVPVAKGRVRLNVPAGTRSGARFRLRGQGLPSWGGRARGDLFLVVGVR